MTEKESAAKQKITNNCGSEQKCVWLDVVVCHVHSDIQCTRDRKASWELQFQAGEHTRSVHARQKHIARL